MDHPPLPTETRDDLEMDVNAARLSYKIFSTVICFLGIWTNYIIIRTILKNKPMRTPTNAYISNWAIYDLLYLILAPVNFLLEELVTNEITLGIFRDIEGTLEFATILLITMFLFDHFITNKHKRFLAVSWVVIIVCIIISIIICSFGHTSVAFPQIITNVGYAILFLIFVTKVIMYNVVSEQQKDGNYRLRLAVAFTYVFCWVFRYVFLYLSYVIDEEILLCLARHANIIGYTNSIFNVFILTLLNKQFYTNLFKMLGCRAELNGSPGDEKSTTQLSQP